MSIPPRKGLGLLCACAMAASLAGCPARDQAEPSPQERFGKMPRSEEQAKNPKRLILLVVVNMVTFEVPLGTASESERLWSYLDEESVGVRQGVSLGRNGLRVGVGREADWPDVAAALKEMTGRRVREGSITALPGEPASLDIQQNLPAQTIFTFFDDRTLSGADYPPGDNVLTFVCTLNEDDPSIVRITAVPLVRATRRQPGIYKDSRQLLLIEQSLTYPLQALTLHVQVRSKDFLVIGPNAESRRECSFGRAFLTTRREGMQFETIQVLVPHVFATPARERNAE